MQKYTELKVWRRCHELALWVYGATKRFPAEERFGLVAQMRRAAVSMSANIAEGSRRARPKDSARFLNIAEGSVAEVECLVLLSRDLGLMNEAESTKALETTNAVAGMLSALRSRVEEEEMRG